MPPDSLKLNCNAAPWQSYCRSRMAPQDRRAGVSRTARLPRLDPTPTQDTLSITTRAARACDCTRYCLFCGASEITLKAATLISFAASLPARATNGCEAGYMPAEAAGGRLER